jgi:hypothetical protein
MDCHGPAGAIPSGDNEMSYSIRAYMQERPSAHLVRAFKAAIMAGSRPFALLRIKVNGHKFQSENTLSIAPLQL